MNCERKLIKSLFRQVRNRIPIRMGKNAVYGQKQILGTIIYESVENISAEAASRELDNSPSSDDILHHLRKQDMADIQQNVENVLSYALTRAKKRLRISSCMSATIAIDYHEISYYGDINANGMKFWVVGSKQKGGTNYFLRYATVDIVYKGIRFTLFALPVSIFKTKEKAIHQLIEIARKHVKVDCVLLDKGFCSVGSIKELESLDAYYVMPKPRDPKTKRAMAHCIENKITSMKYTMGTKRNNVEFNLIVYKDRDTAVAFASNKPTNPAWTAEFYKKRWGIETGYRVKKDFRAKTTSRSHTVRAIYFLLSVVLYNLWVLCNLIVDLEKERDWMAENYRPCITARMVQVEIRKAVET